MLLPKKNRVMVYSELFKEGVLVAHNDLSKPKHDTLEEIPNLHVVKLMQSLKSRGYVRETFNWLWSYFYLTEEGIEYLREYLHLPEDIVPNTHRVQERPAPAPFRGGRGGTKFDGDKQGSNFRQNNSGGFGRGQAAY